MVVGLVEVNIKRFEVVKWPNKKTCLTSVFIGVTREKITFENCTEDRKIHFNISEINIRKESVFCGKNL